MGFFLFQFLYRFLYPVETNDNSQEDEKDKNDL